MRDFKEAVELILASVALALTIYFIISCMGGI